MRWQHDHREVTQGFQYPAYSFPFTASNAFCATDPPRKQRRPQTAIRKRPPNTESAATTTATAATTTHTHHTQGRERNTTAEMLFQTQKAAADTAASPPTLTGILGEREREKERDGEGGPLLRQPLYAVSEGLRMRVRNSQSLYTLRFCSTKSSGYGVSRMAALPVIAM